MKRKLIVISASVLVLALIVGMGFYAQSRNDISRSVNTEVSSDIPESCKNCPEAATCLADQSKKDGCIESTEKHDCSKCEKKETCTKSGTCDGHKDGAKCDPKKCESCPNKATCANAAKCDANKTQAASCPSTSTCTKSCDKKKN